MHVCARSGELLGVIYNLSNVSQWNPCEQQLQGYIFSEKKKLNALGSKKNLIDTYELLHIIKKHHQSAVHPIAYSVLLSLASAWLCIWQTQSPSFWNSHPGGGHRQTDDNVVRKFGYSGGQDAMGTGSKDT